MKYFAAAVVLAAVSGLARESWPTPGDDIKQRDAAWNAYEQQIISNTAPEIAAWAKKG